MGPVGLVILVEGFGQALSCPLHYLTMPRIQLKVRVCMSGAQHNGQGSWSTGEHAQKGFPAPAHAALASACSPFQPSSKLLAYLIYMQGPHSRSSAPFTTMMVQLWMAGWMLRSCWQAAQVPSLPMMSWPQPLVGAGGDMYITEAALHGAARMERGAKRHKQDLVLGQEHACHDLNASALLILPPL